jgi:hypothetical protein
LTLWTYYLPRPLMKALGRRFYRRWPVARCVIPTLVDEFRPTEAVLQSVAMCRVDDGRHLGQLRRPTLGIVGDATRTGVRLMERAMAAVPGARLEVVRDSFDPSNLCQPAEFNLILARFLKELSW